MVKKIFDETALNIFPLSEGFIIAFRKSAANAEKMTVAYSLVSFKKGSVEPVTRNIYQLAKFGANYKVIDKILKSPFYWKAVQLPGQKLLTYYPDGKAIVFDSEANIIWNGTVTHNGKGPCDIIFNGTEIWASFGSGKCICRLDANTLKEELVIGGETSPFGYPEGLFADRNSLFVCDAKLGKIWRINTDDYFVSEDTVFGEPIHQLLKLENITLVRVDSGVYTI